MLDEVLEYLNLAPGKKILDCTLGAGGHARAVLERIAPDGRLIGIDSDAETLKIANERLKEFKKIVSLTQGNFKNLKEILTELNIGEADGSIFDLGISSFQLGRGERGFSLKLNGPLDMRMDTGLKLDAGYLVNRLK